MPGSHPFQTDDLRLQPIYEKVLAQDRLSADDALTLYCTGDILAVGWMANHVRERMHGDKTYFNVNRHINPTNVCVAACRLCAFGRKKDAPGAYTMALEEAFQTAASGYTEAVTDHLLKLRTLQDETGGFQTFIPLAFHPDNTPLQHLPKTTGMLDIKQISVSRLVLDNFPHIKAYWQMMTPKIAQISLRFGADDIDGTVIEEKIYHDAGATTPQGMRRQELVRLIREAGREPIERDTLYRPVTRTETSVTVAV